MSLATNPPVFAYYSSGFAATPTTGPGVAFVAGANSTDGAAVTVLAALTHDVHKLRIRVQVQGATGGDCNAAGDLLIDLAGGTSWSPFINDLVCGFGNTVVTGMQFVYEFPIFIPAGASLGWQCKWAHTVDGVGTVVIEAFGEPNRPELWWCGSGVETLGISDAKGTAITSGVSGAVGTWTSVGSPTTRHIKAIQLGVNGSDSVASATSYHFQLGMGSQVLPGTGIVHAAFTAAELGYHHGPGLMTCNVPIGTQMQVRGTCATTGEVIYVALYGVY